MCLCASACVGGSVKNIAFYYFAVLFDSLPRSESCNLILEILCVPSSPATIFELLTLKAKLFRCNGFQLNHFIQKVVVVQQKAQQSNNQLQDRLTLTSYNHASDICLRKLTLLLLMHQPCASPSLTGGTIWPCTCTDV